MKRLFKVLSLGIGIIILSSCTQRQQLNIAKNTEEIRIPTFIDFGTFAEDVSTIIDKNNIKQIRNMLRSARVVKSDVDMPKGDYDLLLVDYDGDVT